MIQKLKKKFILINMGLVSSVLLITFGIIIYADYKSALSDWDKSLRMTMYMSDQTMPDMEQFDIGKAPRKGNEPPLSTFLSFRVDVNSNGEIIGMKGNNVEATDEFMTEAVGLVLKSEKTEGFLPEYKLRFLIEKEGENMHIAFVDTSRQVQDFNKLILTLLLVGGAGIGAFFVISLFLAELTIKPVKEAWEKQRQFVADASHELKTPLTVILANAGILLSNKQEKIVDQEKWIYYIKTEALRMKKLVEDMLFLAKADVERPSCELPELNFSEVVWSSLLPFESVVFEQGIKLQNEITDNIFLKGNEGQLRQLIAILMDNACKYTNKEGCITAKLFAKQDKVLFSVNNTGVIISKEEQKHIFERFYRVDESRVRIEGGYGLGLSIAKSIVEKHKAKILVTSMSGQGTTFVVSFQKCHE